MSSRRILLDAGNTRLKWAVVADGLWLGQGSAEYSDLDSLRQLLDTGCACYIASVTSASNEQRIDTLLTSFDIVPRRLKSSPQFKELVNGYEHPQQLGVDRWMGLIAARGRTLEPTLVVSVGTAMTVDSLSAEGVFLGGLIVPGLDMMRQSLLQGAAQVGEGVGVWQAFPRSTADAVRSGIVTAMCGAIQTQHERLAEECGRTPGCILTGGDALMLQPHLTVSVEHVPALILEGIERVASEDDIA
jgi:type III pantothenate kinase